MTSHPCHQSQIARLRRAEGQIRGVVRLINDGEYCIDILNQLKAAQKALASVEANILETHLESCVTSAIKNSDDADAKISELTRLLKR
ncbi:MAG: metal-sensitive transcriptional regulator [Pseudomonadota bacterium]|jgi:DNA-binding FrmR family transcriptional regulator|nr:metal-sensitive transcriptional regulator [Pseudomonadota bacterium]